MTPYFLTICDISS